MARPNPVRPPPRRTVNLALQGGGAHGAYTAGVLDALLEDGSLDIEAASGASAGALNAAVLACGIARGGAGGARQALRAFWRDVARSANPFGLPGAGGSLARFNAGGPAWAWWNAWMQAWSPYQFNPTNLNPLRDVVAAYVDEAVLRDGPVKVLVTATSVRTGQAHLFQGGDLSLDALMASTCLPTLFRAVEIGGEAFWDGGYSGNPSLWPLVYHARALDVLLVQIDPLLRADTPTTAAQIADRLNEITFNTPLVAEMRAISFVQRLVQEGRLPRRYKALRMHRIAADDALAPLDLSSKYNNDANLIDALWAIGQDSAKAWLVQHRASVGTASTFDIEAVFLNAAKAGG